MAKAPHHRNDNAVTEPSGAANVDRVALALARLLGRAHALESLADPSLASPAKSDSSRKEAGNDG